MKKAKIALVTSGGIVPKENPDKIESSSASKFGRYSILGVSDLTQATYETAHGGDDPTYVANSKAYAAEIGKELLAKGVDVVILTST